MSKITEYIEKQSANDPEFARLYKIEQEKLDFALQVAQARKSAGLTQKELAAKNGKPQSTISRIETGEMNPTIELIIEISMGLGKKFVLSIE